MLQKTTICFFTRVCFFILTFTLYFFVLTAQDAAKSESYKKKLKHAENYFKIGSYFDAINYYLEVNAEKPEDAEVTYHLGESYFFTRDYKTSEIWYKKTFSLDPAKYPDSQFKYALSLKNNAKYNDAIKEFQLIIRNYKGNDATEVKKRVKDEIKGCEFALTSIQLPHKIYMKHLNESINGPNTDFAPLPVGDSLLIYSSLSTDKATIPNEPDTNMKVAQIYWSKYKKEAWTKGVIFSDSINDENIHTGNGSFSDDLSRFYFTKCEINKKTRKVNCAIYLSYLKDRKWQSPVKLSPVINNDNYTSTHPFIQSIQNKKISEILYFASDRPGGEGGMDIWYSLINPKGEFQEPANVGRKINSTYDEMTPFMDKSTSTMYFSSNRAIGMGGFDVYSVQGQQKKWTKTENLGHPINTSLDDLYYALKSSGTGGFLVSNRPGIITVKSETCCDDIFEFNFKDFIFLAVTGAALEERDNGNAPVDSVNISLYLTNQGKDIQSDVNEMKKTSMVSNAENEDVLINNETITVEKNNGIYFFSLKSDKNYKVVASKDNYLADSKFFNTLSNNKSDTLKIDLLLKKKGKEYVLKNILYDYNKATLNPESKNMLDSLVIILQENAGTIVEIASHTDSKGEDKYNIQLSQKRAESVVKYLIANGIQSNRLIAKGYGETKPIAPNTNPDGSDNAEGRQLNRRTSFKVIGEIKLLTEEDI